MEISQITDDETLEAWLKDKPREWAQVIAARAALRVAPRAFSVGALSEKELERKQQENLILLTFRALFISSADRNYPADDMKVPARAAADAAARAATYAAARAADAAARAATYAAARAAAAADAADAAARAAAYAAAAAAAADAAARAATYAAAWEVVRTDCLWLQHDHELRSDTKPEPAEQARALMMQPIWMGQDEAGSFIQERMPNELVKAFDDFQTSQLAQETSFGLIADWYKVVLEGKSAFGKKADLAITQMSREDWGDYDDERDCIAVMDRVAELVGWSRDMTRADDLYLDDDMQEAEHITVPPQEAAPLEVEIKNGKIERSVSASTTHVSDLEQVHRILRAETEYFIERIGGQSPDARSSLENLLIELNDAHPNTVILAVGYWHGVLSTMIVRLDEQILGDAAGRFAGLINNLDLFLKQHDEWNNYIRVAQSSEVSNASHDLLSNPVQQVMDELAQNEQIIDQEVFSVLRSLKVGLGDALSYNPETAYGFYRSLANVTQSLVELAISEGADALSNYVRDVGGELRKQSVTTLAAGILVALGYQFVSLTTNLPSMFGFLNPVLKALRVI